MARWKKGEAVWITVSKGGEDVTAVLKAPGVVMSGTIAKESCDEWFGKSEVTWSALDWLLTTARTGMPWESWGRTCEPMKPFAPVRRTCWTILS